VYGLDPTHLIVLTIVILVIFGPRRLPGAAARLAAFLNPRPDTEHTVQQALERRNANERGVAVSISGEQSDSRFIWLVADLCNPSRLLRSMAAEQLSKRFPGEAERLRSLAGRGIDRAEELEQVLALRQLSLNAAGEIMMRPLARLNPWGCIGLVYAIGVANYRPAMPLLCRLLTRADATLFVAAARALARMRSPEVIPVLVALALPPAYVGGVGRIDENNDGMSGVSAMLAAARWRAHEASWLRQLNTGELYDGSPQAIMRSRAMARSGEWTIRDEHPNFATDALWEIGEVDLLRAVRQLGAGDASGIIAHPDPRLFEALVVALAQNPRSTDGQVCMAAVEGLEALGDARCHNVLEAYGERLAVGAAREVVLAARTGAVRVRERLAAGRGELAPSEAPAGTGSEVAANTRRGAANGDRVPRGN